MLTSVNLCWSVFEELCSLTLCSLQRWRSSPEHCWCVCPSTCTGCPNKTPANCRRPVQTKRTCRNSSRSDKRARWDRDTDRHISDPVCRWWSAALLDRDWLHYIRRRERRSDWPVLVKDSCFCFVFLYNFISRSWCRNTDAKPYTECTSDRFLLRLPMLFVQVFLNIDVSWT